MSHAVDSFVQSFRRLPFSAPFAGAIQSLELFFGSSPSPSFVKKSLTRSLLCPIRHGSDLLFLDGWFTSKKTSILMPSKLVLKIKLTRRPLRSQPFRKVSSRDKLSGPWLRKQFGLRILRPALVPHLHSQLSLRVCVSATASSPTIFAFSVRSPSKCISSTVRTSKFYSDLRPSGHEQYQVVFAEPTERTEMTTTGDQQYLQHQYSQQPYFPQKRREDSGYSQKSSQHSQHSPSLIDALANDLSVFSIAQQCAAANFFTSKCASDSGASTGDQDFAFGMKEEGQTQTQQQQIPGAWFFEVGDDASTSPVNELDDAVLLQMRTTMGVRNITQSVDVPSSEHVAEIVGRQGCKIKALRAKTNTYIKTPVRGEDPVFVVTGRPEDVLEAKREIECAAEHFTQIRASRRHSQGGAPAPGHITTYVRVPLRVVGLVVGPKGATIKRIQQDTHTYIITPSREREPIFEVTGLPHNVEAARKEIEQHIYQRTGNMPITNGPISQYPEHQMGLPRNSGASTYGPTARSGASSACGNLDYHNDFNRPLVENSGLSSLLRSFPSMRASCGVGAIGSGTPSSFNNISSSPTPFQTSNVVNTQHNYRLSHHQSSHNLHNNGSYQPWSSSACITGFLENDIFSGSRPSAFSSSVWSSSLGMSGSKQTCPSRDEGLGDSPTNPLVSVNGGTFGLLQSIWSDVADPNVSPTNRENEKAAPVAVLSA
ncbi:unnamed protein product [Caenorhabditis auriculariae]|uniref:K Homology domain-containing protein n=1 Tax=Caenorhabditis auriculariae TaxID=2777116 RepID=A0A8S1GMI2_9PELO|nr:unnamed protein product [Caenorhabditis auriculariae]